MIGVLIALVLLFAAPGAVRAHQASIAVMSVTEIQPGRYALRWDNRPFLTDEQPVAPIWPETCAQNGLVLVCTGGGLTGRVGFEGLGQTQSAAMLKVRALDGTTQVVTMTAAAPTARIVPNFDPDSWAGRADITAAYVAIGFEHILQGIDHLLFVLGLMWVARGGWMLVRTITAFTIAHSVTLTAVTFGWVGVPEAFVNAMIALSIAFIGVEILRAERGQTSVTLRRPWLVAFGFGLLHGFGFANALMELGLPGGAVVLALGAFNIGVEAGQLAFVLLALALAWAWREMTAPLPRQTGRLAAYAIGGAASFWFVDRFVLLLGA